MISDFAVFSAILIMVVVDLIVGLDTDKLRVPDKFEARSLPFVSAARESRARDLSSSTLLLLSLSPCV